MYKHRIAFTLAEVLITLGIIGIVAALTIPNLIKEYQEYSWKQAWKKDFSVLTQVYQSIKYDNGGDLSDYFPSNELGFIVKFTDYMSVGQNCSAYITDICGSNPAVTLLNNDVYKTLSDGIVHYANLQYKQYLLKDGSNLYSRFYATQTSYMLIFIDVNGYKRGPNTLGKDLFGVNISKDRILPMGAPGTGVEDTCNSNAITCPWTYGFHSSGDCAGAGCSAEYLYN